MNSATRLALTLLTATVLAASLCGHPALAEGDTRVAIAIHGGAGTITREELSEEREKAIRETLARALQAGHARLTDGMTAMDAVEAAIVVLEDSPLFNAGHGAVFNSQGGNELDAAVMDGRSRNAGAVTGVRHIKNPILLARRVMNESPHVMLAGSGAEEFALSQGFELVPGEYFHTERRWQQFEKSRQEQTSTSELPPLEYRLGTVGAVALDRDGNVAAGTSTGGMTNKRFGRIGDVPVIGAGTYADNDTCAVSATGHGEYFIRAVAGHDIAAQIRYAGKSLQEATEDVVMRKLVDMGGTGGVISINRLGEISMVYNTPGMYRGSIDTSGRLLTAIYGDE
jgi:beta-aspartyl-peptidase (threonine type)